MTKKFLWWGLIAMLFTSCYSVKKSIQSGQPYAEQINWPEKYALEDAKFFVHNEADIEASPSTVWNILIQAETWSDWYEGASNVNVENSNNGVLVADAAFTWKTMGLDFESTIEEFIPHERLSWESDRKNIKGYHAWLIIPTENGCKLVTQESQHGWLTFMQKTFVPRKLRRIHDVWLAEIKRKAEEKKEDKL